METLEMYLLVQAYQYGRYSSLLDQSFRLRKKIFHDTLGWRVDIDGEYERDPYDDLGPAYLMWCNDDATRLYGMLRLLPTTGPTLLHDVFGRTCPDADLMAPGIWEGTRMCIDVEAVRQDFPDLGPSRAFCLLLLALCECAMAHGIDTLVCNFEPQMARIYRRAGLPVDEVGRADGYGRFPVCCGVFDVSTNTYIQMRNTLGVSHALYLDSTAASVNVLASP